MDAHPDTEANQRHLLLLGLRDDAARLLKAAAVEANDYPSHQTRHTYRIVRDQFLRIDKSIRSIEHPVPNLTSRRLLTNTPHL